MATFDDGFAARDSPRASDLDQTINSGSNARNLLISSTPSSPIRIQNNSSIETDNNNQRFKVRQQSNIGSTNKNKNVVDDNDDLMNRLSSANKEYLSQNEPCCGPITKRMCKIITIVLILVFLLFIGFVGVLGGDWIANIGMKSELVLTSWKSQLFNIWQDGANMDIVIHRKYYFFNLTNPREVYYNRVAPDFRVVGPFVYKTNRVRPLWSIFWDVQDDINYRYHDYQFWDEDMSKDEVDGSQLHENLTVTSINMALFTATYRISKIPDFTETILPDVTITKQDVCLLVDIERLAAEHRALGPKGIFTQRTVKEWLWGFKDETLQMLHDGSKIIDYHVPVMFKLGFNDSIPAPGAIDFRHGQVCPLANFEDGCNDSMNADSAAASGRKWDPQGVASPVEDLRSVGVISKWAGNDKLWWFGDENNGECQRIRGTEGLFVGANTKPEDTPEIFVDGVYRSVKLQFLKDSEVEGLPSYRFIINNEEVELGPNSKCYNLFHKGAFLNLSQVAFAEGYVSAKYMYPMNADEKFFPNEVPYNPPFSVSMLNFTITDKVNKKPTHIQDILRTQPTEETYSSFLDIHPLTGSTLQAESRLQINSILKPIVMDGCDYSFTDMMPRPEQDEKGNTYTSYFPQTSFPVLLIDRVAAAPIPIVNFLKENVVTPLLILKIVGYVSFGLFAIVLSVSLYMRQRRRNQRRLLLGEEASREREYLVK